MPHGAGLARCGVASTLGVLVTLAVGAASAQPPPPAAEHDAPLPPGNEPRPLPAYRESPPTNAADAALWAPRVALFPLYVASEYAIRRPIGAVITLAERQHWRERWYDFFTFDDARTIGLFPTGRLDLGLRPRFGFYFFWLDAMGDSDVKLRTTTGGLDAWTVNALLQQPLNGVDELRWTFDFARRPDATFYGLGRDLGDQAASYRERRFVGRATYAWHRRPLSFSATGGVLAADFDPGHEELGDESLAHAIQVGRLTAPPALKDGVVAVYTGLSARFDTRPPRLARVSGIEDLEPRSATGFSIEVHAAQHAGLQATRATAAEHARLPHWLRGGASLVAAVDITGTQRTLQLGTLVELAEPLPSDNAIPFTEQVSLGGERPLRAFSAGHLIDESAFATTLSYGWPIWPYLDGNLHYSLGNVFPRRLEHFDVAGLRSSFGLGMDSVGSLDHPFEILVAFGTRPFNEGSGLETFRLVFGTRAGF
jgi:hypothetical protein